jgi:hypothetical protein
MRIVYRITCLDVPREFEPVFTWREIEGAREE